MTFKGLFQPKLFYTNIPPPKLYVPKTSKRKKPQLLLIITCCVHLKITLVNIFSSREQRKFGGWWGGVCVPHLHFSYQFHHITQQSHPMYNYIQKPSMQVRHSNFEMKHFKI